MLGPAINTVHSDSPPRRFTQILHVVKTRRRKNHTVKRVVLVRLTLIQVCGYRHPPQATQKLPVECTIAMHRVVVQTSLPDLPKNLIDLDYKVEQTVSS
jgi:hypothetical protein